MAIWRKCRVCGFAEPNTIMGHAIRCADGEPHVWKIVGTWEKPGRSFLEARLAAAEAVCAHFGELMGLLEKGRSAFEKWAAWSEEVDGEDQGVH